MIGLRMSNRLQKITDYPAYLEACWQEHLAPRADDAPSVISTFAGCGGSSLGYSMAGFRELLAVELDDNAVAIFKLNFPDVPVYHNDIAKLSVSQCLEMTGLQPGVLDVLDGSPPCQGFSTLGKHSFNDDRNQLFREYMRLLRGLKPKVLVMENVSGLAEGRMRPIFAEILRELKASGYQVSARLLNAMYFGVSQSRQRIIFIGVREDLGIAPSHPVAETMPVMVGEAWKGLPKDQDQKIGHCWTEVKNGSKTYTNLLKARPGDKIGNYGWVTRLKFNAVSGTIPTSGWHFHPEELRRISMREGARLSSFCDEFDFGDNWRLGRRYIGNSVPPLMMRAIAKHIRCKILA